MIIIIIITFVAYLYGIAIMMCQTLKNLGYFMEKGI